MQASLPWSRSGSLWDYLMPQEWARDAACKDVAEEDADRIFFPERGGKANAARKLCKNCPVAAECLQYALKDQDAFEVGVWGGTTPKERRKLQRVTGARRRPIKQERRKPPKLCHCGARAVAHNLCRLHYERERRPGSLS
jgi:hypothetical protein